MFCIKWCICWCVRWMGLIFTVSGHKLSYPPVLSLSWEIALTCIDSKLGFPTNSKYLPWMDNHWSLLNDICIDHVSCYHARSVLWEEIWYCMKLAHNNLITYCNIAYCVWHYMTLNNIYLVSIQKMDKIR